MTLKVRQIQIKTREPSIDLSHLSKELKLDKVLSQIPEEKRKEKVFYSKTSLRKEKVKKHQIEKQISIETTKPNQLRRHLSNHLN
jgi:hypothetical protein